MKRIFFFFLVSYCVMQVAAGQENLNPFIGEWTGVYGNYIYDIVQDEFVYSDLKLVVRIEQFGSQMSVRVKELKKDGTLLYYWDNCSVVDSDNNTIIFTQIENDEYDIEERYYYHTEKTYKLIYEQGRIHLEPINNILYKQYPSGGVITKDFTHFKDFQRKNMYLYKNDNW